MNFLECVGMLSLISIGIVILLYLVDKASINKERKSMQAWLDTDTFDNDQQECYIDFENPPQDKL